MTLIRPYLETDWPALWPILRATFEAGDTYAYAPDSTEADIHRAWIEAPSATYVAIDASGALLGTYFIKPNQPGLGAHVCNCGYVVAAAARGQGVAAAMCEHSQREAVRLGFLAMQFNLVVATNEGAIRLWRKLGFAVLATLPRAFRHRQLGLVDALVMFKTLG
ncbi:N-acetyltransferase [Polaromonas sp.]|jgi:ribosomal protein S18 acetylase RimI-like enzyme|uniref:GNAT family N-acetyltransferase n=1 Tax=Polaromonas sp. TaxID=1869339 RepID=UPI002BF01022|nr:N-acetyltransferase [Polaromonas sp.]HQS30659.1 N-acetyltransferase [Polaromonas sp.]HQS90499.1 N-acetyltransferase [Polaromonas sp.]